MAINSYQDASRVNKKSLGELIREKSSSGEFGAVKSVTGAISDKMAAKSKGFKEKFDYLNIVRMLMGNTMSSIVGNATGRKREDIEYFANKGVKNKKGRANQVNARTGNVGSIEPALYSNVSDGQRGKLRRGDGVADVLAKLYNLIKSDYTNEAKKLEIEKSFKEKQNKDKEKWHKELLGALGGGKAVKMDKSGNVKQPSLGGGLFDGIMEMFKNLTAMLAPLLTLGASILGSLATFLISPVGLALLGLASISILTSWLVGLIGKDPQAALRGEGGIGMAVAGPGSEGQLPSYAVEQTAKKAKNVLEKVRKVGPEKSSLEDLKVAQQEMIDMGYQGAVYRVKKGVADKKDEAIAKEYNSIVTAIESKSTTKIPAGESTSNSGSSVAPVGTGQSGASTTPAAMTESASAPTATPAPAEASPIAERAQAAISENQDMMNQEYSGTQNIVVDASKKINSAGGGGQGVLLDTSVNVRTDDTTLQKILKQNLRPV
jgi:hypothetical protein